MTAFLLFATIMPLFQIAKDAVPVTLGEWDISWTWIFNFFVLIDIGWLVFLGRPAADGDQDGDGKQDKSRKQANRRLHDRVFKTIATLVFITIMIDLGRAMPGDVTKVDPLGVFFGLAFYLFVLWNGGWFFYLLAPLVRRRILNAILFMVLFVCGCALYYFLPVDDSVIKDADKIVQYKVERQIEAPNRTVAAFFPSRGGFETVARGSGKEFSKGKNKGKGGHKGKNGKKGNNATPRMLYFVFHTFVLFYVALITFAIFGRGVVNRVRKWIIRWKRLNVFWGRSDVGLLLARSLLQSTERDQVFFMLQQRSGDGDEWRTLTRDIDDMDGMWAFTYDSNAVETDVSKDTLSQAKGRRHFFMDESGHVNVSMADRIVKLLKDNRPTPGIRGLWKALRAGMIVRWWKDCYVRTWKDCRKWWKDNTSKCLPKDFLEWCKYCKDRWSDCKWDKPFLYVRIEASSDELTYQTWAANVRAYVTPVLIRESQLIAKDFIKKYPLLKIPRVAEKIDTTTALVDVEEINILLIGLGSTGQDILNEIICNGQFVRSYENGHAVPVHLHVDVVEQDEKVIEEYCIRHPLATRHPKFSAIELCNGQDDPRYDVVFVDDKYKEDGKDKEDDKGEGGISAVECGDKRYEIDLGAKSIRVEDKSFDNWFRMRLGVVDDDSRKNSCKKCPYDRIIVCLKGDDKTLGIARKIVEFSRRHGVDIGSGVVFARVKDPSRNRYLRYEEKIYSIFSDKKDNDAGIMLFGDLDKIYSFERIDVETIDEMAKWLNLRYNTSNNGQEFKRDLEAEAKQESVEAKRESVWENASFFSQLSSRAAAEGQRNLLLLRGLDYRANVKSKVRSVSPKEVDAPLTDDSFNKEHSVLKTLSINEHLRWNAFHLMMGFRPWTVIGREDVARGDIPEQMPKKNRANQLATIGKHADIIEFEKLPEVDMVMRAWKEGKTKEELGLERKDFEGLTEGSSQAWDIAFCQIIGKVAAEAGQEIVELKPRNNA